MDWSRAPRFDHPGCPFCDIAHGRAQAEVFHTWPESLAIAPLNPVTAGHRLVIPLSHVRDLTEDPALSAVVAQRVSEVAHEMVEEGLGVNVITSIGQQATQTVFHLHIHVIPRKEDDGLKLPWTT